MLCSLKDEDGNLWFGNEDGTLTYYERRTRRFEVLPLKGSDGTTNQYSVWSLFIDSRKRFWVGTERGVLLLDRNTSLCRKMQFRFHKAEALPLHVRAITETSDHSIWLGTTFYGVCKVLDNHTLRTGYEQRHGMTKNSVRSLLASSNGQLYIGYMSGFAILSPRKDAITRVYTTQDGLCNDFIGSLTEDATGQIWIGSNSGISRYSRHQRLFYNYYISGSNRSVACIGQSLLWGNNKNLTYFNSTDVNAFSTPDRVVITRMEVNNRLVEIGKKENGQIILQQSLSYTSKIVLNHENRDFSLTFNNLSFSENQQKYSYRLYPYQHTWNFSNGDEIVSYDLPAGEYTFEVKNVYPDERECKVTTLAVTILPHWSGTWSFRLFVLLLLVLGVLYFLRRIKRRQRRMEHELHLEYEAFTATMERDKEKQIRMERENFFTNATHELRTPLTLILAPMQELLRSLKPVDALYDKVMTMYRNGNSLHTLMDHLLYVQKIEAGMVKLRLSKANATGLVAEVAESFRQMAETKGYRFSVELPEEPVTLWIDVEKIISALRNLLSNAFKYTLPGGEVRLRADRMERDGKMYFRIVVTDKGTGIPEELQERIFDSFITGDAVPQLSTKTGVGLRIVKNTMDLHHGAVLLNSMPGGGSTFTLLIPEGDTHFAGDFYERTDTSIVEPKDLSAPQEMPFPPSEAPTEEIVPKKRSILIIEDNDEMRSYLVGLFRRDYAVCEAINGEEGLQMATERMPDIILSDVMMPVKDGFTCCREIREQPCTAHIPILMLTAKAEEEDILHASNIGVDDYMMKPFNPELLKSKVLNLIRQRECLKRIYTKTLMLRWQKDCARTAENETGVEEEFIGKVIQVIEAHLSDRNFSVNILAGQLNMSQPTLHRKIKQGSELAAIDMIRSVRMSKAATLLMEHRYSIQEIAEMVGYIDTRTLRKHFTEQFGVPPSKYMEGE